jgi:hypothetical protein
VFLLPLTKEHILMRNQNLVGFKLPELSEAAEQDKGRRRGRGLGGDLCALPGLVRPVAFYV